MKKLIKYVFILSISIAFSQKNVTLSQALNIASKQSMLSGRLAKGKVFKSTHPNNTATKQKLGVSLIQFEKNLSLLKDAKISNDVLFKVSTIEMLWDGYKKTILDQDKSSIEKAIDFNNVIATHTKDIFNSILVISETKKEYPYNTKLSDFPSAYIASNDLKYLSQKLSLYYNAYYSKVKEYDAEVFGSIIAEIDEKVVNTIKLKESTGKEIETKTKDLLDKWVLLKSKIKTVSDANFLVTNTSPKPEYIFNQSDLLLKEADLLTRLYKANSAIN